MRTRIATAAALLLLAGCDATNAAGPNSTGAPTASSATPTSAKQGAEASSPYRSPVPAAPLATAAHGYTATAITTPTTQPGRVITTPQVRGGDAAVTARFNAAMQASVAGIRTLTGAAVVNDGGLDGGYRSGVTRIGSGAVAGRVVLYWDGGGAHPNLSLGTVVIDTRTAQPVTVDDLYRDRATALERLRTLLPELDITGRLTHQRLSSDALADDWLPTPAGLEIYVSVPHVIGDYVPVTVPWNRISDLLKPGVETMLRAD
ncbi:hypothetical protein [Tsukamurella sp. PLM1]|uniref:hypothetical protein n=1 Tax=Tsukamurella sp. PLM1 TaxID=2929795 RepID=UPI002062201C|nr:hypothetical protein [Tsukamurella sp. PLM1]BDH59672.1 hypothetical protein MTP03_46110 [Tsukamurella sp. PLM1]